MDRTPRSRSLRLLAVLILAVSLQLLASETRTGNSQSGGETAEDYTLAPGRRVGREIGGSQRHSYQLLLESGQVLDLIVRQQGVDLVVALVGPEGETVSEVDSPNGTRGLEFLFALIRRDGVHRVEVRPLDESAPAGRYEISIEALRTATARDRDRLEAERHLAESLRHGRVTSVASRRKALEEILKARHLYRRLEDRSGELKALNIMGGTLNALHQYRESLDTYTEAVELARGLGRRRAEASALMGMGFAAGGLRESESALERYAEALSILEDVQDRGAVATAFNNMAAIYDGLGELDRAIEHYQKSLQISRDIGARRAVANTLTNLGLVLWYLGETQQALDRFQEALPITRQTQDRLHEANTLTNMGLAYWSLGARSEAVRSMEQSVPLWQASGDPIGEATALTNLGHAFTRLGDAPRALRTFQRALELNRSIRNRSLEAHTLANIGSAHWELGDSEKALEHFAKSIQIRRESGLRRGQALALLSAGKVLAATGDTQKASRFFNEALELASSIRDQRTEAASRAQIARILRGRGDLTEARGQIELALNAFESLRGKVASHNLRSTFLSQKQEDYEFYLDLLMELHEREPTGGHDSTALLVSERTRARGLLEMIEEASLDLQSDIDPMLKRRIKLNQAGISSIRTRRMRELSKAGPDPNRMARLEADLREAELEGEGLEREIRRRHPRYAGVHYPKILGLDEIRSRLGPDTAFLEYRLGEKGSHLFAITSQGLSTFRLPPEEEIKELVTRFRDLLKRPGRRTLSRYIELGSALYRAIVHPARGLLAGKARIIIAADGPLHYIPFEALLDGEQAGGAGYRELPYLIRRWAVSYAASASLLARLDSRNRRGDGHDGPLVAFGDPKYGAPGEGETPRAIEGGLRSLTASRDEVIAISDLYPEGSVFTYLGADASEETAKRSPAVRRAGRLHFATHAILREDRPLFSGLVLSVDDDPSEDGLLHSYEIFDLDLKADLVVLSACETALGPELEGEGLLGLSRAFFYAGASSLIVSHWQVSDRFTADFMVGLYRQLARQPDKSKALRDSKLEWIDSSAFSHPYYWAAFVLNGDPGD